MEQNHKKLNNPTSAGWEQKEKKKKQAGEIKIRWCEAVKNARQGERENTGGEIK